MARRSTESKSELHGFMVGEVFTTLIVPLLLLIGAAVLWLIDKLNPNFASRLAQDKSNFLPFLVGAVVITTFAAVWLHRKYGSRYKRVSLDEREQEAEEFYQSRMKKPVRK